jgi:YesN/AraC family two-component response regulator
MVALQNINSDNPIIENLPEICDFFGATVGRVNQNNANYLGEAALYYAFAQIADRQGAAPPIKNTANLYDAVIDYINRNYSNPNLSLSEISGIYFYSEKTLSSLIKKNLGIGFTEYLTNIRINKAIEIMRNKGESISCIALNCGFSDPLYFSKVFKKHTGKSPSSFLKETAVDPIDEFVKKYSFCDYE